MKGSSKAQGSRSESSQVAFRSPDQSSSPEHSSVAHAFSGTVLKILLSLRTTLLLVAALVALSAWGSFAIQLWPEDYATIESDILWNWLRSEGLADPTASWWIVAMVGVAALLAANTLVCVVQRLGRHWRARSLPLRSVAAHGAHLGFLMVLGAHLWGALAGFRSDGHATFVGQSFGVQERGGWAFRVSEVDVEYAPEGYPRSMHAVIAARRGGETVATGTVRVNRPLVVDGVATYLKGAQNGLRGWKLLLPGGREVIAALGRPVGLDGGRLTLVRWMRTQHQGLALLALWEPLHGRPSQAWLAPRPGARLERPPFPPLRWGEIVVDTLGIFDVRYDPGATLALAGSVLLSVSLLPLLWPRHRPKQPSVSLPRPV